MGTMERVIAIYRSFEEADRADREYYRRLTPAQRLEILFELNERVDWSNYDESQEESPSGYRIIRLHGPRQRRQEASPPPES